MDITDAPLLYQVAFMLFSALLIGLIIVMTLKPRWQCPSGLAIVSFVCLPLGVLALAILASHPYLIGGALFVGGVLAAQRCR